eukprot:UN08497
MRFRTCKKSMNIKCFQDYIRSGYKTSFSIVSHVLYCNLVNHVNCSVCRIL